IYQTSSSGSTWMDATRIRGPNHTGMVFATPRSGAYYQLESHIHQPGETLMRIRGNTINYESFAIALDASDLGRLQGSAPWPSNVVTTDMDDMLERIDWIGMRDDLSIPLATADALVAKIRHHSKSPIQVGTKTIDCLFVVHQTGDLRFYCPRESAERIAMNDSELAAEKADVIHRNIKSGRVGGRASADEFGGDNKKARLHDDRFDWNYPQPEPLTTTTSTRTTTTSTSAER
ncbi:MAG TPA: hypothetical protein VN927_00310, partial [Gemmatimonadaceae bacterium]|nr:hypothetical protein [Gemmatimonadaceae bacterium]